MTIARKIFSNTVWQTAIRLVNLFIGIISLALITRLLGPTNFGFYTTIFAFAQMAMILADLGLYLTLLREVSTTDDPAKESYFTNNIFTIRILTALLFVILAPLTIQLFPYAPEVKTGLIFFIASFFFQSLISTLTAVFAKKLDMPKVAITDLLNKLVYLGLLAYWFIYGGNLNWILIGNSFTQGLSFVLLYIFLRKHVNLQLAWDFKYWKKVFILTWPLAVTVVLNLLYFKADTLILSIYHLPETVGLYGAPYRVLEALAAFPHMFMGLILPLFTAAWVQRHHEKLQSIWQSSFNFFAVIICGIIAFTWLTSRPLMILLAGEEFAASAPILNILIVATAIIFFGVLFTYLVVAIGAQKQMVKYFLITAAIGLIGYFMFIPQYSYWAAAGITVLVEALIVIFAYLVIRQHYALPIKFGVLFSCLLSAAFALLLSWPLLSVNIFLAILVLAIVYLTGLYLSKAITKEQIKQLFSKQN